MDPEPLVNPYLPPLGQAPTRMVRPAGRRWFPLIAVVVAFLAFHGFVIMLLLSNGVDQKAGMLMGINSPVMIGWLIMFRVQPSWTGLAGSLSAATQVMVMMLMRALGIGAPGPVYMINGIIIACLGSVTLICFFLPFHRAGSGLENSGEPKPDENCLHQSAETQATEDQPSGAP